MNYKDQLYHSGVLVHADDTLMHYGVKGMEWGEHKARDKKPTLKRSGTATKKTIGKSQAGKATQNAQRRSSSSQQSSQSSGRGKNVLGSTSSLGKKGSGTGSSSAQGHGIANSSVAISQYGAYVAGSDGKNPYKLGQSKAIQNMVSTILDGKAKDGMVLEMTEDGNRAILRISSDGKYSVQLSNNGKYSKDGSKEATKDLNKWLEAERSRRAALKSAKGSKKPVSGKGSQKAVIK